MKLSILVLYNSTLPYFSVFLDALLAVIFGELVYFVPPEKISFLSKPLRFYFLQTL